MNFCGDCGNKIDPRKKFCTNCGAALNLETTPTEEKEQVNTQQEEVIIVESDNEQEAVAQQNSPSSDSKPLSSKFKQISLGIIGFLILAFVGFQVTAAIDNTYGLFDSNNDDHSDKKNYFYEDEVDESEEIEKERKLYEYAKGLPEKLTNPNDDLGEVDTFGYEVYSFTQKEYGVYHFETDKGEYLLRVREHPHPNDPAYDNLFGVKKTWFIEDWYTNQPIMRSIDWDDYNS